MLFLIQKGVFKDHDSEKGIICVDPPIWPIPSELKSNDNKYPKVSTQITEKSFEKHYLFSPTNAEPFVKFIHSFSSVLEEKGYLKNIEKNKAKIAAFWEDKKVV